MPDTPAIEVRHLSKQYATGKVAVDDVSFSIEAGETFALLGPNGAGKSTTVEILEGYRSRTAGDVRVLGHDPARASRSHNARVGIVLQSSGESPNVTVAEQLDHFAKLYPKRRDATSSCTRRARDPPQRPPEQAVRRPASARRRRTRDHRPPRGPVPRRADDRLRPRGPSPVLGPPPTGRSTRARPSS